MGILPMIGIDSLAEFCGFFAVMGVHSWPTSAEASSKDDAVGLYREAGHAAIPLDTPLRGYSRNRVSYTQPRAAVRHRHPVRE